MSGQGTSAAEGWLEKAEAALQKATEAIGEAWKATEEVRGQAWETAKHAVDQAAEALDQGLEAARETWQHATGEDAAEAVAADRDAVASAADVDEPGAEPESVPDDLGAG
jgi:hypothetical protein